MDKIMSRLNEARALVKTLKAEHRALGIHDLEAALANASADAVEAAKAAVEAAKAADKELEAKRVEARKTLDAARDELRKEFNRRVSAAASQHTLDALRLLARRECISEARIRASERVLAFREERRGA